MTTHDEGDVLSQLVLYPLADIFGIPLGQPSPHELRGHKCRKFEIGPWEFDSDVMIETDFVKMTKAAIFVKLRKSLWAYVVSKPHDLRLWLFDSYAAADPKRRGEGKLSHTERVKFWSTGDEEATLARISNGVVAAFFYNEKSLAWEQIDHSIGVLDERLTDEGAILAEGRSAPST